MTFKPRLQTAQIRAALAANSELIQFYWGLGKELIEKQKSHQWGTGFLEQFSHDMREAFPEMQGFSVSNLQRMKKFATLYPSLSITAQAVPRLPWGHIIRLMQMVKDENTREWYATQTIKNGWSRSFMEVQIETGLYERQAIANNKTSNYHKHLPELQSDLANELLKDPYNFDFLTIQGKAHERSIENALITHIRDFLIELGQGFAFVGSQVPLTFDDQEFFVDLLFYHLELRAFVVIELKNTKFKPEHTGQLGFYLAAVDDQLRKPGDNQTIGILLCKSKNKVIAEYALRNISAPIGVSEYTLSKSIPTDLKGSLPTVEEIEAELNESVKES
ncbi:PDDEXK nuclease domain-containing protein [Fluoribacter gormanii]|uniref:PDDEXK nuclease domain-containing protein n=1 Tax=Fluoribacter gormanii TaxID=464 RepID=UPI001041B9D4|nr:PDDEXK nuclease domain-containing protein [Fluoribacter gormanii]